MLAYPYSSCYTLCIIISSLISRRCKYYMKFSFSFGIFQIPWLRILPHFFGCLMLWTLIFFSPFYGIRYWCGCGTKKKSSTCRVVVAVIVIILHLFSLVSLEPSNSGNKSNKQPHSTAYYFLSFILSAFHLLRLHWATVVSCCRVWRATCSHHIHPLSFSTTTTTEI